MLRSKTVSLVCNIIQVFNKKCRRDPEGFHRPDSFKIGFPVFFCAIKYKAWHEVTEQHVSCPIIHHTTGADSYTKRSSHFHGEMFYKNDAKSKLISWQCTLNFSLSFSNVQAMQRPFADFNFNCKCNSSESRKPYADGHFRFRDPCRGHARGEKFRKL